jgi:aldose 1-epimerase
VKNHLHGGFTGFSNRVWDAKKGRNENGEETLELTYFSKDKEEGYPGNVSVQLVYTLTDDNAVEITFTATTDQTTIITLTSHPYFNLLGNMNRNVLNHVLYINADHAIECNQHLIPTGNIISILNTPLDFTQPQAIGARLHQDFPGQLFPGKGYVVAYALNKSDPKVHLAARVEEKETGRQMEVYTDQPSLQLYTAWLFDGREKGKYGERYNAGAGLALEAQGYPDAPNHSQFPPIILKPEAVYRHKTIYRFLCESLVGL